MADDLSPSQLAEFLRSHREVILERWHDAVRDRPSVQGLSTERLIDHLPELLDSIAETGEAHADDPSARLATESAEEHALERLVEGMDLSHVVIELAVLRDCILQVWDKERAPGAARPEVRFLNRSVDRAIVASVDRYTLARDRTLRALDRISAAALESRRLDDLLHRLLQVLVDTTAAVDTGVILLREEDDLVVRAAVGMDATVEVGSRQPIGEGFAGRIAAEVRPRVVSGQAIAEVGDSLVRGRRLRCLYGVPLMEEGLVVGVAHIGSFTATDFSDQDKRLFQAMAARASNGIVQHQLRESAQRTAAELAAVIEGIPDAVLVGDARGVQIANKAALAILGVSSTDELKVSDKTLAARIDLRRADTGEEVPPSERPFAQALKGRSVVDEFSVRNVTSKEALILRVAAAPVRSGDRVVGAVVVATDVTARRRDEQERHRSYLEAQQAIADRQHVLAVVSHDLRNPLNTIVMASTMLEEPRTDPALAAKSVASIRRAATRMNRMISDLLDLSSIQAGRLSVAISAVDVAAVVDEALDTVRSEAEGRGLQLDKDVPSLLVRADRDRLIQALANLLGNAVKVTTEGSIAVRVARRGDEFLFAVIDTGPGVPPEILTILFEPYWRAKEPAYKGTGLGLAITRGIVEAHGGRIWVESKPGSGTTFYFTLPA